MVQAIMCACCPCTREGECISAYTVGSMIIPTFAFMLYRVFAPLLVGVERVSKKKWLARGVVVGKCILSSPLDFSPFCLFLSFLLFPKSLMQSVCF